MKQKKTMSNKTMRLIVVAGLLGIGLTCMGLIHLNRILTERQQESISAEREAPGDDARTTPVDEDIVSYGKEAPTTEALVAETESEEEPYHGELPEDQVILSALQKLEDVGAICLEPGDGYDFKFTNLGLGNDAGICSVSIFTSEELALRYAASPKEFLSGSGKLIFGSIGNSGSYVELYAEKNGEGPHYYPASAGRDYPYNRIPRERYADSWEECDYLLLTVAQESQRDEDYYLGSIDRVQKATLGMVIDVKNEEVVYAETVYVDIPANTTYNPCGQPRHRLACKRLVSFAAEEEPAPGEDVIGRILADCTDPNGYALCDMNQDGSCEIFVMVKEEDELVWFVYSKDTNGEYTRLYCEDSIAAEEGDEIFLTNLNGVYTVYIVPSQGEEALCKKLVYDGSDLSLDRGHYSVPETAEQVEIIPFPL